VSYALSNTKSEKTFENIQAISNIFGYLTTMAPKTSKSGSQPATVPPVQPVPPVPPVGETSTSAQEEVEDEETIDEDFFDLFNGKEEISGRSKGYQDARMWLQEGNSLRKMTTCLVFYEKPITFLVSGGTVNNRAGDGSSVDNRLLNYLPQHEGAMLNQAHLRSTIKFGAFKNVNFTMVRRVALLSLQKGWLTHELAQQWTKSYGGLPYDLNFDSTKWQRMTDESRRIKREGIEAFKEDRPYWISFGNL
jgi:hypothetical protein